MPIDEDELLIIPGPTTLSSRVRQVMSKPQQSHVAPEFYNAFKDLLDLARHVFGNSKGVQFAFTGSGSIGMESSVVSLLEPGDKVLSLETGYFGHRFTMMAEIHGAKVETIVAPVGSHIDYEQVNEKLAKGGYRALIATHVDTSTSVMNDVAKLCKLANTHGALSVIDSVCGVGGARLVFDELGADIVLTGSQKALAAPPGATLLAVSSRAFEAMQNRKTPIPSYYMNLVRWKPIMDDPKIYLTTPAVQVLLAVREALMEIKEEGLEKRWKRHEVLANALRSGSEALNLKPLPDKESLSPTVTAIHVPPGKSAEIQATLRSKYGIHLALGFGEYKDSMLRIGHFGNVSPSDIISLLGALELSIGDGTSTSRGKAIEAAMPILASLK